MLQELRMHHCGISNAAFFFFCRGLQPRALPGLQLLDIDENGLENGGIGPLSDALKREALPNLRAVIGMPKVGEQITAGALKMQQTLREVRMRPGHA